jgi:transposase
MIAQERDETERLLWLEMIGMFSPQRLVFLDETGTHTSMTRSYARALIGERAFDRTPSSRGQNQTLIGAISLQGVIADMVIAGATDGDVFFVFVKELLVPVLQKGQVVVMDNLPAHRQERIQKLIQDAGCVVVYLPKYSPDFNPIESLFSWLKERLRSLKARGIEALIEGIGAAHQLVSPVLVKSWFAGCGYDV